MTSPTEADAPTFILRSNSGQFVLSPVAALFRTKKVRWRRREHPILSRVESLSAGQVGDSSQSYFHWLPQSALAC
jgi:hypothetical protein